MCWALDDSKELLLILLSVIMTACFCLQMASFEGSTLEYRGTNYGGLGFDLNTSAQRKKNKRKRRKRKEKKKEGRRARREGGKEKEKCVNEASW